MTVSYYPGLDIFDSGCEALVNPVNTRGVMGRGLAREFANRYPEMNNAYNDACHDGRCAIGRCFVWPANGHYIVNLPTKDHWANPSTLSIVLGGVADLVHIVTALRIRSVAIPMLGCGLGGLDWDDVEPEITAIINLSGSNAQFVLLGEIAS